MLRFLVQHLDQQMINGTQWNYKVSEHQRTPPSEWSGRLPNRKNKIFIRYMSGSYYLEHAKNTKNLTPRKQTTHWKFWCGTKHKVLKIKIAEKHFFSYTASLALREMQTKLSYSSWKANFLQEHLHRVYWRWGMPLRSWGKKTEWVNSVCLDDLLTWSLTAGTVWHKARVFAK